MKKNSVFLAVTALVFVIITSVPYLWGLICTPVDGKFIGFTRNIDDMAVYMSWIKQVMGGNIITYNLFQENAKGGMQFNIYFVLLGFIAKVFHLTPVIILHVFRVIQNII